MKKIILKKMLNEDSKKIMMIYFECTVVHKELPTLNKLIKITKLSKDRVLSALVDLKLKGLLTSIPKLPKLPKNKTIIKNKRGERFIVNAHYISLNKVKNL